MAPVSGQGTESPQKPSVDVSRGPAQGIGLALPWALVFWLALIVLVLL
jgi:hypothetical protein